MECNGRASERSLAMADKRQRIGNGEAESSTAGACRPRELEILLERVRCCISSEA